jgi:hypothetical protein
MHRAPLLLLVFAALAVAPRLAWADPLDAWFSSDPRAQPYQAVHGQLQAVFAEGAREGIPASLLLLTVQEGAAKNVGGERLVAAADAQLGRLVRARDILDEASGSARLSPDGPGWTGALQSLDILLLGGLPARVISGEFAAGAAAGRDSSAVLAACNLLAGLRGGGAVSDEALSGLGRQLMVSSIPTPGFGSLAAIAQRARGDGMPSVDIVMRFTQALESGDGVLAIDGAISAAENRPHESASARPQGAPASGPGESHPQEPPSRPERSSGRGD